MRSISLGCDPEVFVQDRKQLFNGMPRVIPAYKWLPSKQTPLTYICNTYRDGKIFWDGVQAEFTTKPSYCIQYTVDSIHTALKRIHTEATKYCADAEVTLRNVVWYPDDERMSAEEQHVRLGCAPSMNVYGIGAELPPDGRMLDKRMAGAHIHIGDNNVKFSAEYFVKRLDASLGLFSVGAAAAIDDAARRRYYGLAGEFRETSYGLEYRTLSNWWLCNPAITNLIMEMTRAVINFSNEVMWAENARIPSIINACDVDAARKLIDSNLASFERLVGGMYIVSAGNRRKYTDVIKSIFFEGVDKVFPQCFEPSIFADTWHLNKSQLWPYHEACMGEEPNWKNIVGRMIWSDVQPA